MTADQRDDFEQLFREQYPGVLAVCVRITGDRQTGEDAAQEAFARLFARWTRLRHYDRPGAWVRRVAIREAVRLARRQDKRTEVEARSAQAGGDDWTSGVDHEVDMQTAFYRLTPRQRAVALLVWVDEQPIESVARVLGCRPATVRVHLHRARSTLADEHPRAEVATSASVDAREDEP